MATLNVYAALWLLVLQGTGPSSSTPMVFPRNFATEKACTDMGKLMKTKFYVDYLCVPPELTRQ